MVRARAGCRSLCAVLFEVGTGGYERILKAVDNVGSAEEKSCRCVGGVSRNIGLSYTTKGERDILRRVNATIPDVDGTYD